MDRKLEFNLEQESFRTLDVIDYEYGKKKVCTLNYKLFSNPDLFRQVWSSSSKGVSLYCVELVVGGKLEGRLILEKGFDPRPIIYYYFNKRDEELGCDDNSGVRYLNSQYKFERDRILIFKDKFSEKKYMKNKFLGEE